MAITGRFEADFSQFNSAVDTATGKLTTFGGSTTKLDSNLRLVDSSSLRSSNSFGQLSQGLSTADKTLAAFGLHIGPEIHALDEMSQVVGKTTKEIGLIGTATSVAAAALAGWAIGRKIAEFFELDQKIAHLADSVFHLGLATEEAGAKQDSINLAIKRGADANTTYAQAIQFNQEWVTKNTEAQKVHNKVTEEAAKAADAAADAQQRLTEAQRNHITDIGDKLFGADDIQRATDYADAIGRVENVSILSADAQKELADVMSAAIDAMAREGIATDALSSRFAELMVAATETSRVHAAAVTTMETDEERLARESAELAKAMSENFKTIGDAAQTEAARVSLSWSQAMDAVRAGQGTLSGAFQSVAPGTPGSTVRYDDYGNPYGYIPGVNSPGRVSATGGASGFLTNNFYVNGTGQEVARIVMDELTRAMSRGGNRVGV